MGNKQVPVKNLIWSFKEGEGWHPHILSVQAQSFSLVSDFGVKGPKIWEELWSE